MNMIENTTRRTYGLQSGIPRQYIENRCKEERYCAEKTIRSTVRNGNDNQNNSHNGSQVQGVNESVYNSTAGGELIQQ